MKVKLKSVPQLMKEGFEFDEDGDLSNVDNCIEPESFHLLGRTHVVTKGYDGDYVINDITVCSYIIEKEIKSVWTWDKISACDEIGWGCSFENKDRFSKENTFIFFKNDIKFFYVSKTDSSRFFYGDEYMTDFSMFRFFRSDGTEIFSPEDE